MKSLLSYKLLKSVDHCKKEQKQSHKLPTKPLTLRNVPGTKHYKLTAQLNKNKIIHTHPSDGPLSGTTRVGWY